ncbi:hypothetical protein ACH4C6_22170 [Streptomyces sp. NPDC017943]|uniref:hypothetical protein n=1 Tax=Streptomyces sp. NPDC017943 TaxID=3365019 RepID=UPI00379B45FD
MVRVRAAFTPRPDRTAAFAQPYARLADALHERGRPPGPAATPAYGRLNRDTSAP